MVRPLITADVLPSAAAWYTPSGAWQACTTHRRQWPSWSSSSAGSWPCCTWSCSRKHLQTLGCTKKENVQRKTKHWAQVKENLQIIGIPSFSTFMATGYMVAPISKLPFLNIMTDVLLMQVPEKRPEHQWGQSYETSATAQWSRWGKTQTRPEETPYKTNVREAKPAPVTLTLWKY